MRKTGGMELSINAIVILIIAMVVLGIGILFIRGMFAKAQTTTFKALSAQETTNPASADRPFVADKEIILSTTNPTASLAVSVYNTGTSAIVANSSENGLTINMTSCVDNKGITLTPLSNFIGATPVTRGSVPASAFAGYQLAITLLNKTRFQAGDSVVCTLKAESSNNVINHTTSVVMKIQATS
jgi:hypothetical protein